MPGLVSYQTEGAIYGRYLRQTRPDARIALLIQNDDFGRDYAIGFKRGLGDQAARMVVAEATYEATDPTIDSQILALKASNADAFFSITLGKFSSQSIARVADSGWKPRDFIVPTSSTSINSILGPAGLDKAAGLIAASNNKSVSDPQWDNDPGMATYRAFLATYMPGQDPNDTSLITGYHGAMMIVQILKQCGDDLSRANVMRQAANMRDLRLPMLLPGVAVNTSPDDFLPYQQMRMQRFDGRRWLMFGDLIED